MKSFGTKEITDEIVEHDDLATKSSFSFSRKLALGEATCQSAHRKQKKLVFFFWREKRCHKKGTFFLFRREKKKKHFGKRSRHHFFVVIFWMIELPVNVTWTSYLMGLWIMSKLFYVYMLKYVKVCDFQSRLLCVHFAKTNFFHFFLRLFLH